MLNAALCCLTKKQIKEGESEPPNSEQEVSCRASIHSQNKQSALKFYHGFQRIIYNLFFTGKSNISPTSKQSFEPTFRDSNYHRQDLSKFQALPIRSADYLIEPPRLSSGFWYSIQGSTGITRFALLECQTPTRLLLTSMAKQKF